MAASNHSIVLSEKGREKFTYDGFIYRYIVYEYDAERSCIEYLRGLSHNSQM